MGSLQTGHEVVVSPNRDRHTPANKVIFSIVACACMLDNALVRFIHLQLTELCEIKFDNFCPLFFNIIIISNTVHLCVYVSVTIKCNSMAEECLV